MVHLCVRDAECPLHPHIVESLINTCELTIKCFKLKLKSKENILLEVNNIRTKKDKQDKINFMYKNLNTQRIPLFSKNYILWNMEIDLTTFEKIDHEYLMFISSIVSSKG